MVLSIKLAIADRFDKNGYIINAETQFVDEQNLGFYEGEGVVDLRQAGDEFVLGNRSITPYFVEYDFRNEQQGFVFERDFRYYFTKHKFDSYLTNDDLFVLNIRKKVANAFLKELSIEKNRRGIPPFLFKDLKIDFDRIIANSENVTGLWSQVNRGNLTSQAFFGDNVTEDAEVRIALSEQKTSFVQFDITLDEKLYKIGITKNGTIVFYTNFPPNIDKKVVLETTLDIYDLLIKERS